MSGKIQATYLENLPCLRNLSTTLNFISPRKSSWKQEPIRKGQSAGVTATDHWKFLLACRQTYIEGRAVFCEETIVSQDPRFHPSAKISLLTERVSDFTMTHVRHLRCIKPDTRCKKDISNVLSQFPKLTTCHLRLPFTRLSPREFDKHDTQALLDLIDVDFHFLV